LFSAVSSLGSWSLKFIVPQSPRLDYNINESEGGSIYKIFSEVNLYVIVLFTAGFPNNFPKVKI